METEESQLEAQEEDWEKARVPTPFRTSHPVKSTSAAAETNSPLIHQSGGY